eukprot:m.333734 g.333734  ORF g.333734 m.333734 type:complete len:248 (+) comp17211_c0_seq1:152-895(+)
MSLSHNFDGVQGDNYAVRYVGSIELYCSLNKMDKGTKSAVCDAAVERCLSAHTKGKHGIMRRLSRKRRSMNRLLADYPETLNDKKGIAMIMNVSPYGLTTIDELTGDYLAFHPSNKISFVLGDSEGTRHEDFILYGTKEGGRRFCHVLDCGLEACQILTSVAELFDASKSRRSKPQLDTFGFPIADEEVPQELKKRQSYFEVDSCENSELTESSDGDNQEEFDGFEEYLSPVPTHKHCFEEALVSSG